MLYQASVDLMNYVQANLPGECASRDLTAPREYHDGLPVRTMIQQYPACFVDFDSGDVGGDQGAEALHTVYVAVIDRDQDYDALNARLKQYVDAILAALDGKRFDSVLQCTAQQHDSSDLLGGTGDSRAVRMRWVRFVVRTME